MEVNVSTELYIFLSTVGAGLAIGLVYDLFRVVRARAKATGLFADLQDIIFWLITTGIVFTVIFVTNNGRIRWFEFMGVILGLVLYFFTISWIICRVLNWFLSILVKFFLICFKIILTPVVFLYKIISKPIRCIHRLIRKALRKCWRRVSASCVSMRKQIRIKRTKT